MSSFKRSSSSKAKIDRVNGLKSWINGVNFVSTGHRQLDEILAGGIALGTITILENDGYSIFAEIFLNYAMAESISQLQNTFIFSRDNSDSEKLLTNLPHNLTRGAEELKNNDNASKSEDNLKIAWQYGKYLVKGKMFI